MADSQTSERLHTLTEISQKTGISMPTLQRYKKMYQGRIPSVGKGRSQRYPDAALAVFQDLKQENIGRRGRPRKNAAAGRARAAGSERRGPGRPPAAAKSAPAATGGESKSGLLTLTQIGETTGISYPTLLRYVKSHGDKIPTVGRGRGRRYKPEAVDLFRDIRSKSRRGRKSAAALAAAGKAPAAAKAAAKPAKPAKKAAAAAAPRARRGRPPKAVAAPATAAVNSQITDRVKQLEARMKSLEKLVGRPLRVSFGR